MKDRAGFTLIEAIVTVACIGLLAALTLMAVQGAREAGRRVACVNNMKQLSLAMFAYQSREAVFPSAMPKAVAGRAFCTHSTWVRILPELEMLPLFNTINFSVNQATRAVAPENSTAASFTLGVFLCPSDGGGWKSGMGMNSYRVNMGTGVGSFLPASQQGAFQLQVWLNPADFSDGMATTALISERLVGDGKQDRWNPQRDYWFADTWAPTLAEAVEACANVKGTDPPHYSFSGSSWFLFGYDRMFYNHVLPPCAPSPDCSLNSLKQKIGGGEDGGIHCARSNHAGGVNMAAADGSVRFVKSTVAVSLWRALGTRAGGEIVEPGF